MSRSFKKNPVVKDSGSKKWVKREASKSVRRFRGVIANGGAFRKIFCSWDINDLFHELHGMRKQQNI